MKTTTLRELRNEFSKLEAWLGEGEQICIEKRGKPIAMLTPVDAATVKKVKMPDFMARMRKTWGDRVFSEEEMKAMRDAELEGDLG